jgi:hypothetical protein
MGEKKWEYQQISKYSKSDIYPLLLQAGLAFKEQKYVTAAKELEKENRSLMADLLYGR